MRINQHHSWIIIMLVISLPACSQEGGGGILFEKAGYDFPYNLSAPEKHWKLPGILYEISGLSFIDDQRLACVQDEKGIIFVFNSETCKIESQVVFGEDGDYEGLEIIGNDAWILKSNGTLFEVKDFLKEKNPVVTKHPTALSGKNDTEGLAYDHLSNSLLVACKEEPFTDDRDGTGFRAVYRFSLETRKLDREPFILMSMDSISYYKDIKHPATDKSLNSTLHKDTGLFKPSGVAVHPSTGEIYLMASTGRLLQVLSGKGDILSVIRLSHKTFPQPEGICFSPDGTLYIASEGDGGAGAVLEFIPDLK